MFGRREKPGYGEMLRQVLWPRMGWKRAGRYIQHRLVRLKDSNAAVANGLAIGAGISFVPLPGTHILGAAALSWATRGNLLASVIGTLVGNPWTLPLMWWASYKVGDWIFTLLNLPVRAMPIHFSFENLIEEVTTDIKSLLLPWVCGGAVLGILSWPFFYILFYYLIKQARAGKHRWKENRLHKAGRKLTHLKNPHDGQSFEDSGRKNSRDDQG